MHTKERVQRVMEFIWRQKWAAIALLVVAPLLTGMGLELFVLNLLGLGLGIGFLFIRSQVRRRRHDREHRLWLERRAQREEREHQRWLKRLEREADPTEG